MNGSLHHRSRRGALSALVLLGALGVGLSAAAAVRPDLTVSGAQEIAAGDYGKVTISGSGDVSGNLKADLLVISGSAAIKGNIWVGKVEVSGSAEFGGDVQADEFRNSGSSVIRGNLAAKKFTNSGSLTLAGNLKTDSGESSGAAVIEGAVTAGTLKSSGSLSGRSLQAAEFRSSGYLQVREDAKAQLFYSGGAFTVGGLLQADDLQIDLGQGRNSKAHAVLATKMLVQPARVGIPEYVAAKLIADTIEGGNLDLKRVVADSVKGTNVQLGPGCEVGKADASDTLNIHPKAVVEKKVTREK